MTTITEQIVQFSINSTSSSVPASAVDVMRLSLFDWIAVTVAGANEPVSTITREMAAADSGVPEAYVIGLSQRLPARAAALVNGTTSHALDYDDTHFASLGHPSVAIVPAVLALADKTGANNGELQHAILIGMEVAVRIGMWLGREHYRTGFHVTATAGSFGAALASCRLLNLNADQTFHAMGIAASRASGVKAQFGTMGKPLHAGLAASNGVEAAMLAQRGFVAAADGLESSQGFAKTHDGEFNNSAFDDLGENFIVEQVSHKFHACCHGTHAALEALSALRRQYDIVPNAIDSIVIKVHPQYLDICNIVSPATGLQAKFSYQMVAALIMHQYDTARLDTFSDVICKEPKLVALHDKVEVATSLDIAETAAEVIVRLTDSSVLEHQHNLLDKIEFSELEAKVHAKVSSLLGKQEAAVLWDQLVTGTASPTQWMQSREMLT